MTPREGVDVCDMRACPFCHEADFDAVGLKVHLSSGHCDAYESTPSPARTVRLGSPLPAAPAREEAWKAMVDALEMAIVERTFLSNGCGDRIDRALALARATGGA